MTTDKLLKLWNFLGSWFPDADLEGFDDLEVVRQFLATANQAEIDAVHKQLTELLRGDLIPCDRVSKEANRHFDDAEECRTWLEAIAQRLGQNN